MSTTFGPIHGNDHFFQKSTQKFFAIAIRGGRRHPDFVQIGTEKANLIFFFLTESARALLLSSVQFRFRSSEIAQAFFPFGLQAARNQSVFRFDGTILTLGTLRFVARPFYRQTPLISCCILIRFNLLESPLR